MTFAIAICQGHGEYLRYRDTVTVDGLVLCIQCVQERQRMKPRYDDITRAVRDDEEPIWWDENGVPRFEQFNPSMCARTDARQAMLLRVACHHCGTPCVLAVSSDRIDLNILLDLTSRGVMGLYGLPPHFGHCDQSYTMKLLAILSWWRRTDMSTWEELQLPRRQT